MVCAREHVAQLHGLRACRMVTWFAPLRVLRGYMVCTMDSDHRKELARLHQQRYTYHMSVPRSCENERCAIPCVARSANFNAVAFLVIIIIIRACLRFCCLLIPSIVVLVRPTKGVLEPPQHPPPCYAPGAQKHGHHEHFQANQYICHGICNCGPQLSE